MADTTDDTLALLAHELRTPVSTIVAAATGLERGRDTLGFDEQRALVDLVASEAKRLARLVDAVVSAAKLEAGELPVEQRDVDIGELVGRAVAAAAASASAERSVTFSSDDALLARADADRFRQVLDNLIDNALKHAAGRVQLTAARDGDLIQIEVTDDGAGIPREQREAVFEKFHRLDSAAAGSGLGLWLCRELVTRMGGTIAALEAPSGGARFVIELQASVS